MRHLRLLLTRVIFAVVLLLTGIGASPADAQPKFTFAPITSAQLAVIYTLNGTPVRVCRETSETFNRRHGTCIDVATATLPDGRARIAGNTVEFVFYDANFYTRLNAETTWTVMPNPEYVPNVTLGEAMVTDPVFTGEYATTVIGPAMVDGQPTTQIQYWSTDSAVRTKQGGQGVVDLFVTDANLIVKGVYSVRFENGEFTQTAALSDINTPIKVYPPDPAVTRPAP